MIKRNPFPVIESLAILVAAAQHADAQTTDRRVTIDDLGDVLTIR